MFPNFFMKVKLYKNNTEAKVMQAMCVECFEDYKLTDILLRYMIENIFPSYKDADCGKTWRCLICGKQTSMVMSRNCKVI